MSSVCESSVRTKPVQPISSGASVDYRIAPLWANEVTVEACTDKTQIKGIRGAFGNLKAPDVPTNKDHTQPDTQHVQLQ